MKTPHTTCPTCKGTGQAPIQKELGVTLKRLSATKPKTSIQLSEPGKTHGAICNRLVALEALGFAERRGKDGKNILWAKRETGKKDA